MPKRGRYTRQAVILTLLVVLFLATASSAGTLYVRPPFNLKFFWPASGWNLSLAQEGEVLKAVLVKGEGEKEQAVISIEGYDLGSWEDPDTLALFHWTMESDLRQNVENFQRIVGLKEYQVSGRKGYKEEVSFTMGGDEVRGAMMTFSDGTCFYHLILMAPAEVYLEERAEFYSILEEIEFLKQPHLLAKFAPRELLGINVPIVKAVWPAEDQDGFSLVTPKIEAYGSDKDQTVLLKILLEADEETADKRALSRGSREREEIERELGADEAVRDEVSLLGVRADLWEFTFSGTGKDYYIGLLTWNFGKVVFLLRILGPSEDFDRNKLTEAAREVISRGGL